MDGVLIEHRSSWKILHEHFGTSNERSFRLYLKGEIDDEEFMSRDIEQWREALGRVNIDSIKEVFMDIPPVDGFIEALESLSERGISLMILSGGLDILALRLKEMGGFNEVHANGLLIDERGDLEGSGILRVPLRDKGSVLRRIIDRGFGPVAAVGDSRIDVPMFELADVSVAFRPESPWVSKRADHVVRVPDLRMVADIIIKGFEGIEGREQR